MEAILALAAILIGAFTAVVTLALTFWSSDSLFAALAVYMLGGIGGSALILAPVTFRVWMQSRAAGKAADHMTRAETAEDHTVAA